MITFERADIKNFNSIGEIENFVFTPGIHAVKGLNLDEEKSKSNGSGKSSFFDAITWILYGKTPNGKSADAVINRVYGRNCFGKLYFSINDVQYRVERYRSHDDHGDDIKVFINEQDKTIHPPSKNQQTIDDIIQVPFGLFTSSFIIAQGLNSRFTALTDFQRKETIEDIRNNKVWDKSRDLNKIRLKNIKDQIEECELEIAKKGEVAESHQEHLRDIKEEIKDLMEEKAKLGDSSDQKERQEELASLEEEITDLETKIDSLTDERTDIEGTLGSKNQRLLDIPEDVDTLRGEINKYEEVLDLQKVQKELEELRANKKQLEAELGIEEDRKAVKESEAKEEELLSEKDTKDDTYNDLKEQRDQVNYKISELNNKISSAKEKIEFYEHYLQSDHDAEACPTCGQVPEEDSEKVIKEKYEAQMAVQKELNEELEAKGEELSEFNTKIEVVVEEQEAIQSKIQKQQAKSTELHNKITKNEREITQMDGQINSLEKKVDKLKTKLKELGIDEDELSKVRDLIAKNNEQIIIMEEERETLKAEVAKLKEKKQKLTEEIDSKEVDRKKLATQKETVEKKIEEHEKEVSDIDTQLKVKKEDIGKTAAKRKEVIEEKEKAVEDKKDYQEELPIYENLDKIFSPKGIRAHIISKDIGFINQRLDFYSKHFFSDMYVQLDPGIDEEGNVTKIDIPVSTTMNFEKTYDDCSGGERRRIDICVQLAIFDLILSISSVTTNLLVLDEVFEGLDSEGVKAVMDVIKTKSEQGTCIYVISHLPNLGEHVSDEVTFVKKDGVTEIGDNLGNF